MKPYRVIIWRPSGIGNACLREILRLPQFTLAGVLGYSPEKHGMDAAGLIGLPAAGVAVTTDKAEVLRLDADCVLYTAAVPVDFEAMNADIVAILRAGKNVVSATSLHYAPFHGSSYVDRITAACAEGKASIHGTGVDPGLMLERLALGATAMCTSVDLVTLREAVNVAHVPEATLRQYGFGQLPDAVADGPLRELFSRWMFVETISFMIRALYGEAPDRIDHEPVYETRETAVTLEDWTIPPGTVSFIRHRFTGWLGGAPRVRIDLFWHVLPDQVPGSSGDADRWQISIHGQPTTVHLDVAVETTLGSEWLPNMGKRRPPSYHATAAILLQAVPVVCAAAPGIVYPTMFTHCATDFSRIGPDRPVVT